MHRLKRAIVTGGAGFAGSHMVDYLLTRHPDVTVAVADNFGYAANITYLNTARETGRLELHRGDVRDATFCNDVVKGADLVIHMAAESHVDSSYVHPSNFITTNVLGTQNILMASFAQSVPLVLHCSTDEVYGEILSGTCSETHPFNPTNPYSASKAAAEMILRSFINSYNMDVRIVRSNNLFGTRQHIEKVIPTFLGQALCNLPLTIHGSGEQRRCFLGVADFCRGVDAVITRGDVCGVYNIGTSQEFTISDLARLVRSSVPGSTSVIVHTDDRPYNDRRYYVDSSRCEALGWKSSESLLDSLPRLAEWYSANASFSFRR